MSISNVYVSFHYQEDHSRVQQVLNMGVIEGQQILSSQRWEEVKQEGEDAIKRWIDKEMKGKDALLVLSGNKTGNRPWVRHEIVKAWNAGLPVVGVQIHKLKDFSGSQATAGPNPFSIKMNDGVSQLSQHVDLQSPAGSTSQAAHADIAANLADWLKKAKHK